GVMISGRASIAEDGRVDSRALVQELAVEHWGQKIGGEYGPHLANVPGKHVALVLHADAWTSWDHSS
ncbi:MAG: hypothetical protein ACRDH5_12515, partial [bacterium]